jgi:hypothetical protein
VAEKRQGKAFFTKPNYETQLLRPKEAKWFMLRVSQTLNVFRLFSPVTSISSPHKIEHSIDIFLVYIPSKPKKKKALF